MKDVAIDACCLINLLAADCVLPEFGHERKKSRESPEPREIQSLGLILHVPSAVASESLYVFKPDHDDPGKLVKTPIELGAYFAKALLQRCEIAGEDETAYFVGYASRLDDGEAECLALAKNRGWLLATDDRVATTLAIKQGVTVLTTAELLKRWATTTQATREQVTAVLGNIRRFARFVPRPQSPEAPWWLSHFPVK